MTEIEIGHSSQDASGYRSLVRQIQRGLARVTTLPVRLFDMPGVNERLIFTPRTPVLRRVDGSLRYVDKTTGKVMRIGTRFRRWVSDRSLPWEGPSRGDEAPVRPGSARLVVDIPESARWDGADRRLLLTMWESSKLPATFRPWRPHLERADTVIVPCEHNRALMHEALAKSRRKPKVVVVPLGLDAAAWPYFDRSGRPPDAPFIFLMVGDLSVRKGLDLAYRAFDELFRGRSDVWLVLKARGLSELVQPAQYPRMVPVVDDEGASIRDDGELRLEFNRQRIRYKLEITDPNVMVLRGDWRRKSLLRLYEMADCFLWPSRGEGWGYPPREAAATGLPVITPNHTGLYDAEHWGVVLPTDPAGAHPARYSHWGLSGMFYEPDYDSLVAAMRWCYENRTAALEVGRRGSEWVKRRSEADVAADILRLMES